MNSPEHPIPEADLLFRQALRPYRQAEPRRSWQELALALPPRQPSAPADTFVLRLLTFLEWLFIQPITLPHGGMQADLLNRQFLSVRMIS